MLANVKISFDIFTLYTEDKFDRLSSHVSRYDFSVVGDQKSLYFTEFYMINCNKQHFFSLLVLKNLNCNKHLYILKRVFVV